VKNKRIILPRKGLKMITEKQENKRNKVSKN
jgi:hypothetical protein